MEAEVTEAAMNNELVDLEVRAGEAWRKSEDAKRSDRCN